MRRHVEFGLALLLDLLGAAGALLVALRSWQVVTTPRTRPLRDDVLDLSGRTVDSASTALALVALAGVVAVLATRGVPRRVVGAVLGLAGVGLVWRAVASASAVSTGRARTLVAERHKTVTVDANVVPHVAVHAVWPVLSAICGVLVVAAGVLIAVRGHRWQGMSARYEAQPARADNPVKAAAALWSALDRGEDPTSR
ncbi:MAG: family rane protein [Jatrophihabitans sp.]|jgi:uncharacterized membrane protein (TIGR02234 family)|nr:family rane protein [Jatrophihabitans sp.]